MKKIFWIITCILLISSNIGFTDDYGYEDSYDGIVNRLSVGEKTIKHYFDQNNKGQVKKQIEIYREKNGEPQKEVIQIDESQSFPFVNLRIYFDTNSSYIRPDSYSLLTNLGKALTSEVLKNRLIAIKGHTDSVGSKEYNRILSFKRAQSVKYYLINNFNIPVNRLQALGYGSEIPIVGNNNEDERQINRRVEIETIGNFQENSK